MLVAIEMTKEQKRKRKAVRRFNAYLDMDALNGPPGSGSGSGSGSGGETKPKREKRQKKSGNFSDKDWKLFDDALKAGELYLDNDMGFCFKELPPATVKRKDIRRAYPNKKKRRSKEYVGLVAAAECFGKELIRRSANPPFGSVQTVAATYADVQQMFLDHFGKYLKKEKKVKVGN